MGIFIRQFKRIAYFWVASYFAFWARIFLKRWQPTIIAVVGSSGKTTLLHLFEAELGGNALYTHHANSAFGIPFHILGLERKSFKIYEWFIFFFKAPFSAYRNLPREKLYVTEADAERPGEGKFLAELLKPHIAVWLSLEEAHGINYDTLVREKKHVDTRDSVRRAMAHEFGYFLEHARGYVILNADNPYISAESKRALGAEAVMLNEDLVKSFSIGRNGVSIDTPWGKFSVPALIPRSAGLSVVAVYSAMLLLTLAREGGQDGNSIPHFDIPIDQNFSAFVTPPGRSSVFRGKKNTTLIDSTYNATFDGVRSMLELMRDYPAKGEKWLLLGDMIEQGESEAFEHRDLASLIAEVNPSRVIFVGPRLQKYTYPLVVAKYGRERVAAFLMPGEALTYLERELKGNETILCKGARYLEGVVEKLLANPADVSKLCRREVVWAARRKQWGI